MLNWTQINNSQNKGTVDVRHEIESVITKHERKNLTQRMIQSLEILELTLPQLEQNPVLELEAESFGESEERSPESDATGLLWGIAGGSRHIVFRRKKIALSSATVGI